MHAYYAEELNICSSEAIPKVSAVFYNDKTLNEVANALLRYNRASLFNALNACIGQTQKITMMADARQFAACGIVQVIIHDAGSYGQDCTPALMRAQVDRIVQAIRPSLRWKLFGNKFIEWVEKFDPKRKKFEAINEFEELFLGAISFTAMETRKKKIVDRCFNKFARNLGFTSYDEYRQASNLLIDLDRLFELKPSLYEWNNVSEMISLSGFRPEALLLDEEQLNDIVLERLDQSLVPIFYGRRTIRGKVVQWEPLAILNLPTRMCFALAKPRREIIEGAYKGEIFEDYLYNVLTGRLIIAVDVASPIEGHIEKPEGIKMAPGGPLLLDKLNEFGEAFAWHTVSPWKYYARKPAITGRLERISLRKYRYVRYDYEHPQRKLLCNVTIRPNTHPGFSKFLRDEGVSEWEEDILLLHRKKPRHCLIGQAKFTRKYNEDKYRKGEIHVEKTTRYVAVNPKARFELGIPDGFPVVPVLFTSFSGPIYNRNERVMKSTIYPVCQGTFLSKVSEFLSRRPEDTQSFRF
jgi:hypothetical protein